MRTIKDDAGHELGLWPPTAVAAHVRMTKEIERLNAMGLRESERLVDERSYTRQLERERDELKRWAETPPDGYRRFMQLWGACVRLVEKASFKYLLSYMEWLEQDRATAYDNVAKLIRSWSIEKGGYETLAYEVLALKTGKTGTAHEPG